MILSLQGETLKLQYDEDQLKHEFVLSAKSIIGGVMGSESVVSEVRLVLKQFNSQPKTLNCDFSKIVLCQRQHLPNQRVASIFYSDENRKLFMNSFLNHFYLFNIKTVKESNFC